ncbi:MAG: beta-ketoacyl-ACP synthase III [Pseudobdellovibrionaceae bacterium]
MDFSYRSFIAGCGSYLPEKILSNFDLEKMVDTSNQWILERTGIENRHIAAAHEVTSDLCYQAAQKALTMAKVKPEDLDLIIVATVTGDQVMPSTSCVLQSKLGAKKSAAFDLTAACSGFIFALSTADQFIRTGAAKNVLIVGAEVMSRFVDYKDRSTCILFGDGAGAWVLKQSEKSDKSPGVYSTHIQSDGDLGDLFVLAGGGSKHPMSQEALDKRLNYMTMNGREIFKNAVRTMTLRCQEALNHNQIKSEEIDWVVPHQANRRIVQAVADYVQVPMEKFILSLNETGNTSAASIPIAFDRAVQSGRIQRGQNILLTAFGAGLTSGSALLRF